MSRLVVVSNRVGDVSKPTQTGGLAVAVADALRESGGVWFGWSGETTKPGEKSEPSIDKFENVTRIGISLPPKDYEDYYLGYSNSVLWPLLHYRLDLVEYEPAFFKSYLKVNHLFATALQPYLKPNDLIWVHDYHLIPFGRYLRKAGCKQKIGFFLHIPFPPPEILAASPNHKAIVEAMLDYDLIGFQTSTDLGNFRRYVDDHTSAELSDDGSIRIDGRTLRTERFPIGIDVEAFHEMAMDIGEDIRVDQTRRRVLGRKQIIGVDRLDYSKGIPARFHAFESLLVQHPEMERHVSFLQVAPPTREMIDAYSGIRDETEGLAGSINGRFADFDWTPIRYIHRSVPREKLAAIFRTSQVALVTPLRDGMNLVAKEYVAAQDADDPGVLVLSQFAGAAEEMQGALIVNPHDIDDMARSLYTALTMPREERRERHSSLLANIKQYDVRRWSEDFVEMLRDGVKNGRVVDQEREKEAS